MFKFRSRFLPKNVYVAVTPTFCQINFGITESVEIGVRPEHSNDFMFDPDLGALALLRLADSA